MKPLIGITADIDDGSRFSQKYSGKRIVHLWERYINAIQDAGGGAILIPVSDDQRDVKIILERIDGLLVSGGAFDVPPFYYGEELLADARVKPKEERSKFEKALILEAVKRGMPILGICGGEQIINVAFGGSLFQDIPSQCQKHLEHEQKLPANQISHQVEIQPNTLLAKILFKKPCRKKKVIWVNSTHHQAVKKAGRGLKVSALAPDKIIEAIEAEQGFIIGVQWHPELLYPNYPEQFQLLAEFIRSAKLYHRE